MSASGDKQLQALRGLPSVDRVIDALTAEGPHWILADAARRAVDLARERVRAGEDLPDLEEIVSQARDLIATKGRVRLRRVINATGVLLHTNLGRAPLSSRQLEAVVEVASGYSNLEYDLVAGRRGSRYSHASERLTALTGAQSALVVNNNAAAVLLTLSALYHGKEVIISRGEQIEIGGEFRIPEVMALSGARLIEVGTTNRTHLVDYEKAINDDTAAILKVHPSNYRVVGFASSVAPRDLARLAGARGICLIHDVGSGLVGAPSEAGWTTGEPPVDAALSDGADVITFSGDKLLGGPQAGLILGRSELINRIAAHPLLRAMRVDKMTLAALEATLDAYLEGRPESLPLWAMALTSAAELETRARSVAECISRELEDSAVKVEAVASNAVTGGGSLPGTEVESWAVALIHGERSTAELERWLREAVPPVIGRIEDDRLLLDLRTVPPSEDETLARVVASCLAPRP